jgi:hypothetical protein
MAIFTVTGADTLVLNDRVFTDLATDDTTTVTMPNDLVNIKTGKNGNSLISKNFQGYNGNVTVKVARGSSDDQFLESILASMDNDFVGTALMTGSFTKVLGDGQGNRKSDVYTLAGGVISKIPEGKDNASGDTAQAEVTYDIKFCNCRRGIE